MSSLSVSIALSSSAAIVDTFSAIAIDSDDELMKTIKNITRTIIISVIT